MLLLITQKENSDFLRYAALADRFSLTDMKCLLRGTDWVFR